MFWYIERPNQYQYIGKKNNEKYIKTEEKWGKKRRFCYFVILGSLKITLIMRKIDFSAVSIIVESTVCKNENVCTK